MPKHLSWSDVTKAASRTSDYSSGTSETSSEAGHEHYELLQSKPVQRHHLYQCSHCPYCTPILSQMEAHFGSHSATGRERLRRTRCLKPNATVPAHDGPRTFQCPHCTFQAKDPGGVWQHVGIHFDFKHFLEQRGLQVKYERFWSTKDTISAYPANSDCFLSPNGERESFVVFENKPGENT